MVHTIRMKRPIFPYNPHLKEKARELRNNSTLSEVILWGYLKAKQMHGFDFHRQKPIDNYIVDFICCELYLAIELDGYTHLLEETAERDRIKEQRLKEYGIRLIRFWDEEISDDIDNVLRVIEATVLEQKKKLGL
jgi:very-short-patch-repair endonuclease